MHSAPECGCPAREVAGGVDRIHCSRRATGLPQAGVPNLGQESTIKTFFTPAPRKEGEACVGRAYKWPPSIVLTFHQPASHRVPHRCRGTWERQSRGQVSGREGNLGSQAPSGRGPSHSLELFLSPVMSPVARGLLTQRSPEAFHRAETAAPWEPGINT